MYCIFFIYSLIEGHLGYFQFLETMNKAAMNIADKVSLLYAGMSFVYMSSFIVSKKYFMLHPVTISHIFTFLLNAVFQ